VVLVCVRHGVVLMCLWAYWLLADGAGPSSKLGDDSVRGADDDVVDAASAELRLLDRPGCQRVTGVDRSDERDVGIRRDGDGRVSVARAGEGGVGQEKHKTTMTDRVPVEHVLPNGQADGGRPRPDGRLDETRRCGR
jgi:hypothetical protein